MPDSVPKDSKSLSRVRKGLLPSLTANPQGTWLYRTGLTKASRSPPPGYLREAYPSRHQSPARQILRERLPENPPPYASSAASDFICSSFWGFMADSTVTVFSANVISLHFSSIPRMALAATGAQEPFSISPTVRF